MVTLHPPRTIWDPKLPRTMRALLLLPGRTLILASCCYGSTGVGWANPYVLESRRAVTSTMATLTGSNYYALLAAW